MEPFKIDVPQPVLDDLQQRLANTRWSDEIEDAAWNYGTNREYLKQLAAYWQQGYDWRAQKAKLNEFPQFKAEVDDLNIHFLYFEGKGPNSMLLLLVHGAATSPPSKRRACWCASYASFFGLCARSNAAFSNYV